MCPLQLGVHEQRHTQDRHRGTHHEHAIVWLRGLAGNSNGLVGTRQDSRSHGRAVQVGNSLDFRFYLARVLISPIGFLLQRSQDNFVPFRVDRRFARRRIKPPQRQLAGEHFVKDDA